MNVYTFIMISAVNGARVADYVLHSIIVTWNMFDDRNMNECVLFHHDILNELV